MANYRTRPVLGFAQAVFFDNLEGAHPAMKFLRHVLSACFAFIYAPLDRHDRDWNAACNRALCLWAVVDRREAQRRLDEIEFGRSDEMGLFLKSLTSIVDAPMKTFIFASSGMRIENDHQAFQRLAVEMEKIPEHPTLGLIGGVKELRKKFGALTRARSESRKAKPATCSTTVDDTADHAPARIKTPPKTAESKSKKPQKLEGHGLQALSAIVVDGILVMPDNSADADSSVPN